MFSMLWTTAPILVSIISFFTFVVQGKELTVGIAFTVRSESGLFLESSRQLIFYSDQAIALFNMVRFVFRRLLKCSERELI